jgi:hypothetical protein
MAAATAASHYLLLIVIDTTRRGVRILFFSRMYVGEWKHCTCVLLRTYYLLPLNPASPVLHT